MDKLVVLFDEVESHLHPQWQRLIVPSLIKVLERLNPSADVQLIASTHAPLVLAPVESVFSLAKDSIVKFDLIDGNVRVERFPWQSYGDVSSWLTSEVFRLGAARSVEAERAIEEAQDSIGRTNIDLEELKSIHGKLRAV